LKEKRLVRGRVIIPRSQWVTFTLSFLPTIWLFGRQDRIIPAPRSAEIIREIIAEFGRPFSIIIYPNGGHSLRDYWDDLGPWLDKVIGPGPTQQRGKNKGVKDEYVYSISSPCPLPIVA